MQKTSIVIPLGSGSFWKNNELRYCLRAVEKHLSGYGDIFIVGELPDWITNIVHIKAEDNPDIAFKERNIYNKILIACGCHEVTEDFLFMNDDHILLSEFDASTFPFYKKEDLMFYARRNQENQNYDWLRTLVNTITYLVNNKLAIDNFDGHCPIIYNKEKFKELEKIDWSTPQGYVIKSLYANMNKIEGIFNEDVKCGSMGQSKDWLNGRLVGKKIMSLTHYVNNDMREILQELFPNKSKYEND